MPCAVTEMLIPIQAEYYAREGLGQLINTIGLVRTFQSRPEHPILVTIFILGHLCCYEADKGTLSRRGGQSYPTIVFGHHHSAYGENLQNSSSIECDRLRSEGMGAISIERLHWKCASSFPDGAAGY